MRLGLLIVLVLLPMLAAAQGAEPDPAEAALLHARAQARQVADANEVLDGLEKLSRYPEAARVLLTQNQDPALLQALQAMSRPAAAQAVKPEAPKPAARKPATVPRQPPKHRPALRVVGAWAAPNPKAIFLGESYHIVYVGETFRSGAQTYKLRSITTLASEVEGGERRYRVVYSDTQGVVTRLDWPSS